MKHSNRYSDTTLAGNPSFVTAQRNAGFKIEYSSGKSQHSFIYTCRGCMQYTSLSNSFETITAPASVLVFIPAETRHTSNYTEDETQVYIIQFEIISGELPECLSKPAIIEIDNAKEIFSSIKADLDSGDGDNQFYCLYRIYELLWNASARRHKIPYKFRKLQIPLQELTLHYYKNRKIGDYADIAGMSEPGFRRLFKEYTGTSPVEYRNNIRLQEARKLLRSGEYLIEETAQAVGFSNLNFFCRSYKKHFGYSPGKEC